MPFKHHDAHRHHIPKTKYRVRNWSSYNAGLCQRGSLTVWLSPDKMDGWKAPKRDGRGGQRVYSDSAIEAILTLGTVYHLPLRQTYGLTRSVFDLAGIDLPVASLATLCRRRKTLSIEPWVREASEPLHLVVDSTGLKIYGSVSRFMADGADDGEPVYDAVKRHSPDPMPEVIIPPRKTAVLSSEDEDEQTNRDRHILELEAKGRMTWQKTHDYGRRSLVETTMGRYKSIIGDRLRARHDDAQPVEVALAVKTLNQMMNLAKPISAKVG